MMRCAGAVIASFTWSTEAASPMPCPHAGQENDCLEWIVIMSPLGEKISDIRVRVVGPRREEESASFGRELVRNLRSGRSPFSAVVGVGKWVSLRCWLLFGSRRLRPGENIGKNGVVFLPTRVVAFQK